MSQQLQQRLTELQAEQRETQSAIAKFTASIADCQAAVKAAQARYDLQGDDSAKDEVTEHRSLIITFEERRRRAQEQLLEYPARIEAIEQEIATIAYRENLRQLIGLRQVEVEAFNQAEQTMLNAIEDWREFIAAKEQRRQLAKRCEDFARANSLPLPSSGAFNHPLPDGTWFTFPNALEIAKSAFDKARRSIPQ